MLARLLHSRAIAILASANVALAGAAVVTTVAAAGVPRHVLSNGSDTVARRSTRSSTPPRPVLTSAPSSPTRATNALFRYTDAERGVTFACRLQGSSVPAGAYSPCGAPTTYTGVARGAHTFCVKAGRATGATSTPACATWRIVAPHAAAPSSSTPAGAPSGSFTISGAGSGLLSPGGPPVPVDLRLHNPDSKPLTVTSVTMSVTGTSASACAAANFAVVQQLTVTLTLPADATATLSSLAVPASRWPELRMVASGDQQACQRATVYLSFASAG